MILAFLRIFGVLGLVCLLNACGVVGSNPIASSGSSAVASAVPAVPMSPDQLRFAPGDKVKVIVFGEDKISGEYQIDIGGNLSLPLVGNLRAAGLTKPELEQALTAKLKSEYLRNPRVSVEVASFRPFYLLGEVKNPGEFPYRTGLNVLSAIAIGGGATYRASPSTVMIQRAGTTEMVEYPQSPTIPVFPGDVVRVPERYF